MKEQPSHISASEIESQELVFHPDRDPSHDAMAKTFYSFITNPELSQKLTPETQSLIVDWLYVQNYFVKGLLDNSEPSKE